MDTVIAIVIWALAAWWLLKRVNKAVDNLIGYLVDGE